MAQLLYNIVMFTARIHDKIMSMNDGWGYYNNDKQLHFIVMGVLGMIILVVTYLIFKLLQDHIWIIAFIYTFTVMLVITFSIEIGQGYYGTGNMEMNDVVAGMAGFLFCFVVCALVRGIIMLFYNLFSGSSGRRRRRGRY